MTRSRILREGLRFDAVKFLESLRRNVLMFEAHGDNPPMIEVSEDDGYWGLVLTDEEEEEKVR